MSEYLHYSGSKFRIANWIISHFPHHECYVEVFGGTGAVLLRKNPSKVEVYNDADGDLANLIMTIRDFPNQLRFELRGTPLCRQAYENMKREWMAGEKGRTDIERAARYFYLINCAFSGKMTAGMTRPSARADGSWTPNTKTISDRLETMTEVSERLRSVLIECLDFDDLIRRYDSSRTLFYCDPPYENIRSQSRSPNPGSDLYQFPFQFEDNDRLAATLSQIEGHAIVSGYSGRFDELYGGWRTSEKEVTVNSPACGMRPKAVEVLWMNFEAERLPMFEQSRLFLLEDDDSKTSIRGEEKGIIGIEERLL